MDVDQAWIWTLLLLLLDTINLTSPQFLDLTDGPQPTNLNPVANYAFEENVSPENSLPITYRILTRASLLNTPESRTKDSKSEYIQKNNDIDDVIVYGVPSSSTKNSSDSLKLVKMSNNSLILEEGKEYKVESMQTDTKEDLPEARSNINGLTMNQISSFQPATEQNQIQTKTPVLREGSNEIQRKKYAVSDIQVKAPEFPTNYSKTSKLREDTNKIQNKNDSISNVHKEALETSTNSPKTVLLREDISDIQNKKDADSDIQVRAPEFSANYSKTSELREVTKEIRKKNDSVSNVQDEEPDTSTNSPKTVLLREGTNDIQNRKVADIQVKALELSTNYSKTPELREDTDDIQEKNDSVSGVQEETPETLTNSPQTALLREGIDDIQKKNDSVSNILEEAPDTSIYSPKKVLLREGTNNSQKKNDAVSDIQVKASELTTNYSKTPELRENNNAIQKKNNSLSNVQEEAPETTTYSTRIPLLREGTIDNQNKMDLVLDGEDRSLDISTNPSISVNMAKENNRMESYPTLSNTDDWITGLNHIPTVSNEENDKKLLDTHGKTPVEILDSNNANPRKDNFLSSLMQEITSDILNGPKSEYDSSDLIMDMKVEQPSTYVTALRVGNNTIKMDLRNDTETYMTMFNYRYTQLPQVEADNSNWHKYLRAVVERFVLDFCRLYVQNFPPSSEINTDYKFDQETDYNEIDKTDSEEPGEEINYNGAFDLALWHLREKKGQTALQIAIPVIDTVDAFKVAIDAPVGIVQSKCKPYMKPWQCRAHYLSGLIEEAETCPNIWHHAEFHLKALQVGSDPDQTPTEIIIEQLKARRNSVSYRKASRLFDSIIRTIKGLRSRLEDSLIVRAKLYHALKDMEEKDLLGCFKLEQSYRALNFI